MANNWKVKFIDNDSEDYQIASFQSKKDADSWIRSQLDHEKYDPVDFEVIQGPWEASSKVKAAHVYQRFNI